MAKIQSGFTEAHFCALPAQSNVYGLCNFSTTEYAYNSKTIETLKEKVLIACLNGDIVVFEYDELIPSNSIFRLQYTSGKAEIVSVDAFTKTDSHGDATLVLGVTFIDQSCGFSIFTAALKPSTDLPTSLQLATDQGIPATLEAIPCLVTHTQIFKNGNQTTVFLVSTADKRMHMFKEHLCKKGEFTYKEAPINKYFPECKDELDDSIFFLDIKYLNNNNTRLTCTGTQSGFVNCYMVDVCSLTVLNHFSAIGFGPVTSVVIFTSETDVSIPDYLLPLYGDEIMNLLSPAQKGNRDVVANGLKEQIFLEKSYNYDSVLCGCVADVDFDGTNEIILGTFGQKDISKAAELVNERVLDLVQGFEKLQEQQSDKVGETRT